MWDLLIEFATSRSSEMWVKKIRIGEWILMISILIWLFEIEWGWKWKINRLRMRMRTRTWQQKHENASEREGELTVGDKVQKSWELRRKGTVNLLEIADWWRACGEEMDSCDENRRTTRMKHAEGGFIKPVQFGLKCVKPTTEPQKNLDKETTPTNLNIQNRPKTSQSSRCVQFMRLFLHP